MPAQQSKLNHVFHALSDPTRRAVVARLKLGPAAVSELAMPFDMALPSFIQHMGVLEKSGLVSSKKQGRIRIYELTPTTLEVAGGWITQQQKM
ncbi:ArsR/SmtB family transcription factor [Gynuella sp.]|uniref:ArsR/SmtB family transcription factor n=1 Tax=Gynuella sp. TaxID=2969146 RepID=UPI003D096F8C